MFSADIALTRRPSNRDQEVGRWDQVVDAAEVRGELPRQREGVAAEQRRVVKLLKLRRRVLAAESHHGGGTDATPRADEICGRSDG